MVVRDDGTHPELQHKEAGAKKKKKDPESEAHSMICPVCKGGRGAARISPLIMDCLGQLG